MGLLFYFVLVLIFLLLMWRCEYLVWFWSGCVKKYNKIKKSIIRWKLLKLIFRGSNVSIFVKMLSYSHENWFFCNELAPESDQGQQATPDTDEVSAD
jgi:hypothetical protein